MSSKSRAKPAIEGDRYYTPPWVVRQFVELVAPTIIGVHGALGSVLEPSAGGGAFVRPLRALLPESIIHAVDLDPLAGPWEEANRSYLSTDFRTFSFVKPYDLVAGNPPFDHAWDFIRRGLDVSKVVSYLLRVGFLASDERRDWIRDHPPEFSHMLAHRPSFTRNGKSDSCDYAFLTWSRGYEGPTSTYYLPTVSLAERKISAHGVLSYEDGVARSLHHERLF